MATTRKHFAVLKNPFFLILCILLLVGGVYVLLQYRQGTLFNKSSPQKETPVTSNTQQIREPSLGFQFSLPPDYRSEKNGQFSRLYSKKTTREGAGTANFLYVSVIPKGKETVVGEIYNYNQADLLKLRQTTQGGEVVLSDAALNNLEQYYTYRHIESVMIGGFGASAYMNENPWEFPAGTTEYRYIIPFEQATYLIGGYVGSELTKNELDQILATITLTPETVVTTFASPMPEGEWKRFSDATTGLSLSYPSGWTYQKDSQQFPEGDLFSLVVIGQTQRPQTELYDGISFGVMKPQPFTGDLSAWVKNRYDRGAEELTQKPEYSKVTYGGKIYEKVYLCGLGCFTYFHTAQQGRVYGFVVNAVGPNAATYEETVDRIFSSIRYE